MKVKLKWGMSYKGILVSIDGYMNIHLMHAGEYDNSGECKGNIGE